MPPLPCEGQVKGSSESFSGERSGRFWDLPGGTRRQAGAGPDWQETPVHTRSLEGEEESEDQAGFQGPESLPVKDPGPGEGSAKDGDASFHHHRSLQFAEPLPWPRGPPFLPHSLRSEDHLCSDWPWGRGLQCSLMVWNLGHNGLEFKPLGCCSRSVRPSGTPQALWVPVSPSGRWAPCHPLLRKLSGEWHHPAWVLPVPQHPWGPAHL